MVGSLPEEEVEALLLAVAEPLDGVGHEAVHLAPEHGGLVVEAARDVGHEDAGRSRGLRADGRGRGPLQGVALGVRALHLAHTTGCYRPERASANSATVAIPKARLAR